MFSLDSIKIIKQYIRDNHVFTLCTTSSLGDVWCANCFYWFDESQMRLIFLSEKKTRHAKMMQENLLVAGSISTQEIAASDLQGIQFTGSVFLLTGKDDINARKHYCLRFPVALAAIHVPLWELKLQEIKMVNNQLGFGTKLYWQRD
ncbi:YhbP family protein [Proteus terrae]|uniref:YhbP family protein n=1 Tax=Proteus terrae TaxID=1574161 RepID=UPI001BA5AD3B|nr:YhbP family protein [Proteus terrae]